LFAAGLLSAARTPSRAHLDLGWAGPQPLGTARRWSS